MIYCTLISTADIISVPIHLSHTHMHPTCSYMYAHGLHAIGTDAVILSDWPDPDNTV